MSLFLILMIAGLFGMALMALPGMSHHAHGLSHAVQGHLPGHVHAPVHTGHAAAANGRGAKADSGVNAGVWRFLPSPRVVFSLLALYGAFGYAFTEMHWMTQGMAAIAALVPAFLLEHFALTPFWNALLRMRGEPSSDMEMLIATEARAVTPFRNGKGIVEVVRDGRAVQLSARLPDAQATMPVRVGDVMQVDDVDAAGERLTVSLR